MSAVEAVPARRADQDLQGLYERHAGRIFGFCRRRLRSQQEAEDATQTTFLQAYRALQRGVLPVCEKAWLFKIAENVCLTAHRTNGRRSERELADGAEIVALAPGRDADDDALFGLEEALASIPESQRRAFLLREVRGLSYKEIAGLGGISVTAVEMLVFRARRSLARALETGALRGRVASVFDLGGALNALKTAIGGVTVAKVVSAAVAVAVATVPAGDSVDPAPARPATVSASLERPHSPGGAQRGRSSDAAASQAPEAARVATAAVSAGATARSRRPAPPGSGAHDPSTPGAPPSAPGAPPSTPGAPPETPATPPQPRTPATPQLPVAPPAAPPPPELIEAPTTPEPELPTAPELPIEVPELPLDLPGDLAEVELPTAPTLP